MIFLFSALCCASLIRRNVLCGMPLSRQEDSSPMGAAASSGAERYRHGHGLFRRHFHAQHDLFAVDIPFLLISASLAGTDLVCQDIIFDGIFIF